jgi:hypothetical protein
LLLGHIRFARGCASAACLFLAHRAILLTHDNSDRFQTEPDGVHDLKRIVAPTGPVPCRGEEAPNPIQMIFWLAAAMLNQKPAQRYRCSRGSVDVATMIA